MRYLYKKGELTSSQIITIVLAVFGFLIVLWVILVNLDFGKYGEEEVCRLSVLSRSTTLHSVGDLAGIPPLNCRTGKVCLTADGDEDCSQFAGEEYETIVLKGSVSEKAREIEKRSADAMLDCWRLMGEGKLTVFPDPTKGTFDAITAEAKPTCVICSRLALSEELQEDNSIMDWVDVNNYLDNTIAPGTDGMTYVEVFAGGRGVSAYSGGFEDGISDESREATDQMAIIFMQIITENSPGKAFGNAALETGTLIFAGRGALGTLKGLFSIKATALTTVASLATGGLAALNTNKNQLVSVSRCGDLTSANDDARKGCSILFASDYNGISEVNNICARIEGQR